MTEIKIKNYSQLWISLPKGTLITKTQLEKLIGFKEEQDYKNFQFELLRIRKQIEVNSRLNGQALFTRQDAGGIKVMTDEEADDYKTKTQYRLLKRCFKIQQEKQLINTANMSVEAKERHYKNLNKFAYYLQDIKQRAGKLGDRDLFSCDRHETLRSIIKRINS